MDQFQPLLSFPSNEFESREELVSVTPDTFGANIDAPTGFEALPDLGSQYLPADGSADLTDETCVEEPQSTSRTQPVMDHTCVYSARHRLRPLSLLEADDLSGQHTRLAIKKSLLKIYHDCLEGALSCWLMERNCPYITSPKFHLALGGRHKTQEEWGPTWTNRIITQVCGLDRSHFSMSARSKAEEKQASKAFNLAIMAFAAQWAQQGRRAGERLSAATHPAEASGVSTPASWEREDIDLLTDSGFGRSLQRSLWHEANTALHDAAKSSSFKVIFALIVFSLAQKPLDQAAGLDISNGSMQDRKTMSSILNADGPPIFLDMALRQLDDQQRRLKDARRGKCGTVLGSEDDQTFKLLFWLAIMFDTLSAAMNHRSFVVGDRDSILENGTAGGATETTSNRGLDELTSVDVDVPRGPDLWGSYFLDSRSAAGETRQTYARWPCSYEEAASALCDAAPVKVLIFRRVAQLQDLKYRKAGPEALESAINAAMAVYNFWNDTYGRFIGDLVEHHESLPTRIQSWYILLAGHWHLAVFLLADLVEELDEAGMTQEAERRARGGLDFVQNLRMHSVCAVSDLGQRSRYSDEDLSFSKDQSFHFAVNKAALLTEPWTVVLVRSFGGAGEILVKQILSESTVNNHFGSVRELRLRLQHCIDALWLLGKKSDMALLVAKVLAESVSESPSQ